MNFFYDRDLGNHLLQLCPEVVKHPVYYKMLPGPYSIKLKHYIIYILINIKTCTY